jgi:hypothetical protein
LTTAEESDAEAQRQQMLSEEHKRSEDEQQERRPPPPRRRVRVLPGSLRPGSSPAPCASECLMRVPPPSLVGAGLVSGVVDARGFLKARRLPRASR